MIEGEAEESAEDQVRPKTIVYFEWIMFGVLLHSAIRAYLYDPEIRQIATDPVFDLVTFEALVAFLLAFLIFPPAPSVRKRSKRSRGERGGSRRLVSR